MSYTMCLFTDTYPSVQSLLRICTIYTPTQVNHPLFTYPLQVNYDLFTYPWSCFLYGTLEMFFLPSPYSYLQTNIYYIYIYIYIEKCYLNQIYYYYYY